MDSFSGEALSSQAWGVWVPQREGSKDGLPRAYDYSLRLCQASPH